MPSQKHGAIASNIKADAAKTSPSLDEFFAAKKYADQRWQDAVERMLLYLKCLQVTPEEQLGLALEAIRRAGAQRHEHSNPLPACLEALWRILEERCLPVATRVDIGACNGSAWAAPKLPAVFSTDQTFSELVHPSMHRQRMLSAPMELAPWRRRIQEIVVAVRHSVEAFLYRSSQTLGALFALIVLIAHT